jgi:hypothetical protein
MFFHHVVIEIRQLVLRPAACLMSTLLETGVGANDCKCSRDQQLNVPSEARNALFAFFGVVMSKDEHPVGQVCFVCNV